MHKASLLWKNLRRTPTAPDLRPHLSSFLSTFPIFPLIIHPLPLIQLLACLSCVLFFPSCSSSSFQFYLQSYTGSAPLHALPQLLGFQGPLTCSLFSAIFSTTIKPIKKETLPNISRHFTLNVLLGRGNGSTDGGLPKQM